MKVLNKTKNSILASDVKIAESLLGRLKGLLGRKELAPGEGLILKPCYQIHTWFMKFSIDVLFLDKNSKIIHLIKDLKPFKISGLHINSQSVLELPVGTIEKTKTEPGDSIVLED